METRLSILLKDKGNNVYSIAKHAPVYDCAKMMAEFGVGALVIMENDELIGIVSERDIIRKLVSTSKDIGKAKVADIMSDNLVTVPPTMSVTDAMKLVTEKRFRHLPVVENGKLMGIISIGDLTRWAMLAQEKEIESLTNYIHGEHQV